MQNKIWLFLFIFAVCAFARGGIILEYRNGETETIRKATFAKPALFRTENRSVKVNTKKIYEMEIFADTIEIHFAETWVRAKIHPRGGKKDEEKSQPVSGWLKIGTKINGMSSFGRISAPLTELRRIQFRIPEAPATENADVQEQAQETENLEERRSGGADESTQ